MLPTDILEDNEPQQHFGSPDGATSEAPNYPSEIERAPRYKSLWLLPISEIMLLAGVTGIYFLTINLDLLYPVCFLLSLAIVLLGVVAVLAITDLSSPVNNEIRPKPDGPSSTWNRFASLSILLSATFLISGTATVSIFAFALVRPSLYVIYLQIAQPFVLAGTAAVAIILLLFAWLTRIRPLQKILQRRHASLAILCIPVAIYVGLNTLLPHILFPPWDYTGPFASWPDLMQYAKHEADRIDLDATIEDVRAYSLKESGPHSPQSDLFSMTFTFVRPNGQGINIELFDTIPIRTAIVESPADPLINDAYPREKLKDEFAYIKLGPREVYSRTENELLTFAKQNGIESTQFSPSLDTSSSFHASTDFDVSAIWNMDYDIDSSYERKNKKLYVLSLEVDAATGKVPRRYSLPDEGTATPTPQPIAIAAPSP